MELSSSRKSRRLCLISLLSLCHEPGRAAECSIDPPSRSRLTFVCPIWFLFPHLFAFLACFPVIPFLFGLAPEYLLAPAHRARRKGLFSARHHLERAGCSLQVLRLV